MKQPVLRGNLSAVKRWSAEIAELTSLENVSPSQSRLKAIQKGLISKETEFKVFYEFLCEKPEDNEDDSYLLETVMETLDNINSLYFSIDEFLTNVIPNQTPLSSSSKEIIVDNFEIPPVHNLNATNAEIQAVNSNTDNSNLVTTGPGSFVLPKLKIQLFDGNLNEYTTFWDKFSSVIDNNNSLSPISKFSYLHSFLKGDALESISGLALTSQNYNLAKDILKNSFGKIQPLIKTHFDAILSLTNVRKNDLSELKCFFQQLTVHIRNLKSLNVDSESYSVVLTPNIISKLPDDIRKSCVTTLYKEYGDNSWSIERLMSLIEIEMISLQYSKSFSQGCSSSYKHDDISAAFSIRTKTNFTDKKDTSTVCVFCKSQHLPEDCKKISNFFDRLNHLKRNKLCILCFDNSHFANKCTSETNCKFCSKKHNSALCKQKFYVYVDKNVKINSVIQQDEKLEDINSLAIKSKYPDILLQTASVVIKNPISVNSRKINVMFDTGSHRSFIKCNAAEFLHLDLTNKVDLSIATFMNKPERKHFPLTELSVVTNTGTVLIDAIVVPNICQKPNSSSYSLVDTEFQDLNLAEKSSPYNDIELLIGVDHYWKFFKNHNKFSTTSGLIASETNIGWVISGKTKNSNTNSIIVGNIDAMIEKIFIDSCNDLGGSKSDCSVAEFLKGLKFIPSLSKYSVSLPWKGGMRPNTHLNIAQKRLNTVSIKLKNNPILMKQYNDIFIDQEKRGIIERVDSYSKNCHYLPHHFVLRPDKQTTKLRVVYDGSCRSFKKDLSINDCLYCGPQLIPKILPIMIKFRLYKFAITSDIAAAFLQVLIDESDRDFLRFLWWNDPFDFSKGFTHYRFTSLPFGLICSPAILNSILSLHLSKFTSEQKDNFYVDDLLTGANSIDKAINVYHETSFNLKQASFELKKWSSNLKELQDQIPLDDRDDSLNTSVLGVPWNKVSDELSIKQPAIFFENSFPTKRGLLRLTSQIFDVLGMAAPLIVYGKILFQTAWKLKLSWDCQFKGELLKEFLKWKDILSIVLSEIKVCRHLFLCGSSGITVHGFCDASAKAISACIYIVVETDIGPKSNFLCGRARVAPMKALSIPRLELLSALLLVRLYEAIASSLPSHTCMMWSDAVAVLCWIVNTAKNWKQWVQSRVQIIREITNTKIWNYVPTELNTADIGSRGLCDKESLSLWLAGPSFILTKDFPKQPLQCTSDVTTIEEQVLTLTVIESDDINLVDLNKYSSFKKYVRIFFYIVKYIHFKSTMFAKQFHSLCNLDLINFGKNIMIQNVQKIYFSELYSDCKTGVRKLSLTKKLDIHLIDNILKVKTRITSDIIPGTSQYLTLLPAKSNFTNLVVQHYHAQCKHGGSNITIAKIREVFWIIRIRQTVKKVLSKCVVCRKIVAKPYDYPIQPDLPNERVAGFPFQNTGLDFFGPIKLSGDIHKVYILIFTCATTRAVHFEVTLGQSTADFISAFNRFICRRGIPNVIISDNFTTFKSVSFSVLALNDDKDVCEYLNDQNIKWIFTVERAAWYGGFYERLIGIAKSFLKKSLGKRLVTYFMLCDIVCQIELIMNTRPLCYIDGGIDEILTPSHLLTNRVLSRQYVFNNSCYEKIFNFNSVLATSIWKRFQQDYLKGLREHHTNKGRKTSTVLPRVGEVVVVVDENKILPRACWRTAIIVELVVSKDGICRAAEIRFTNGRTTRRALKHLVPLEC